MSERAMSVFGLPVEVEWQGYDPAAWRDHDEPEEEEFDDDEERSTPDDVRSISGIDPDAEGWDEEGGTDEPEKYARPPGRKRPLRPSPGQQELIPGSTGGTSHGVYREELHPREHGRWVEKDKAGGDGGGGETSLLDAVKGKQDDKASSAFSNGENYVVKKSPNVNQWIFKDGSGKEIGEIQLKKRLSDDQFVTANVLVWPEFQRQGWATKFYQEASKWANEQGKKLYLSQNRTNDAKNLHSKFMEMGFLKDDGEINFNQKRQQASMPESFALQPTPTPKPSLKQSFDTNNAIQQSLWHGLNDLPGQMKLFEGMDLGVQPHESQRYADYVTHMKAHNLEPRPKEEWLKESRK